jgi:type I restriction enzyme M protein
LKENDYDDELLKTVSEEDDETVKWVQENIGYFIAYKDLFSTWLSMGKDFDVSNVRDALSAFSRLISNTHKKVFDKVFDTLQTGLSKLGDSSGSQTKAIRRLLTLIKDIPYVASWTTMFSALSTEISYQ